MTHARTQIRNAVTTALTGLTTTGTNVFESHVYPVGEDQLPGLTIYTANEASELISKSSSGTKMKRMLELVVTAYVKETTTYDETIDTIMVEVEEAIQGNSALQNLVKFIYPRDLAVDFSGDGDKPIAIAAQSFVVEYHTLINDVESVV